MQWQIFDTICLLVIVNKSLTIIILLYNLCNIRTMILIWSQILSQLLLLLCSYYYLNGWSFKSESLHNCSFNSIYLNYNNRCRLNNKILKGKIPIGKCCMIFQILKTIFKGRRERKYESKKRKRKKERGNGK